MRLSLIVATFFGAGLLKPAPGTWGTLAAWLVALPCLTLVGPGTGSGVLLGAAVTAFLLGIWACGAYARETGDPDPSSAVIDEVAAIWLLLSFTPQALPEWIAAFFLFRLFDIVKFWPVGLMDRRLKGGFGIMADDIGAAVQAGILLWLGHWLMGGLR